ncbi:MAG: membrane-bound PQQ-dependent dehydrogenase, glucose/quinate/shikimate family [Novosphingobium sp.]|nr:membrane-bound PQQ-dependent dehydrogenase, glucose/quinate/shikimate family [Novosphingobium sp.]
MVVMALAIALAGATLAVGGGVLIGAGGSWYYLLAGLAMIAVAVGLGWKKRFAFPLFGTLLAATLVWALWESGLDGWALVPRLVAPAVLGLILLLPFVRKQAAQPSRWWIGLPLLAIATTLFLSGHAGESAPERLDGASPVEIAATDSDGDWKVWGRTLSGSRFSPLGDITPANVGELELAWQFTSDVEPYQYHSFEATPLAANGKLFVCLDRNVIVALEQETGKQVWRFDAKPDLEGAFSGTCRGVSWYEAPEGTQDCPTRVVFGVNDGRLMQVDSETGKPCTSFGDNGQVDLKEGLGEMDKGMAFPTSPPTVVNGTIIISGWVTDGVRVGEPSGGPRAYDALKGKLLWVFDPGRKDPTAPLAEGETYTRGIPNAWGVFSADPELETVYFGTGVTTPDYFGMHRTPEQEKFATSIVAVDINTGLPRWHFQTVHHDIWDWDIGSQPVLVDLPVDGKTVPALIGPTKRGQFFVLDRRTGEPIFPVTEKPVPQDAVPGEKPAPTQPYSAFPNVAGDPLTERTMWGATPFDQLWCRIAFRKARYEGDFTPPGERETIFYPGSAGGSNWGSVTIDTARQLMVANSLYMADMGRMIPRAEADRMMAAYGSGKTSETFAFPQQGTPFAMDRKVFLGPLGAPCQQPPYGKLSVFDLKTGKLVWSEPLGTAEAAGPLGIESKLPITMGAPNLGGSIATATGLIFIGATQDRTIRAFDIGNGKVLWKHRLPAIGAATPMTYRSRKDGKQYVVIAAGGHPALPGPAGSAVLAFRLRDPQQ